MPPAAAVQTPPSYPPVSPPQTAQPAPAAYPSAPPPSTSGGSALKIILIIVAVFVLLGVLAAGVVGFGIWRVSHAIHLNRNGEGVSISTPNGTMSAGAASSITEADLGVAIYPGAQRGQGSLNLRSPHGSMVTAVYLTSDSASQVADFYKGRLGDQASVMESGESTMITSASNERSSILVTISPEAGKTKITIVHTTKQ